MQSIPTILAAPSNFTEILFGAVFFLIWVASAAMSQMAKQRENQRRERVRREIEMGGRTTPAPVSQQRPQAQPRPIHRTPAPPRPVPPVVRRPVKAPKRPVPRMPVPIETLVEKIPPAPPPAVPQPVVPSPRPTSATAPSLKAWLKPQTLRRQFILTELLQPPLALRDPDASRLI